MIPLAIVATLSMFAGQPAPSLDNDFGTALGTAGLSVTSAVYDRNLLPFFEQPHFRTALFSAVHEQPWRAPFLIDTWRKQLEPLAGKPSDTVSLGGRMLGWGLRRTLLGNPIQGALEDCKQPGALRKVFGRMKAQGILSGEVPDDSKVPQEVRQAAAVILDVALDSVKFRRAAFENSQALAQEFDRFMKLDPENDDPSAIRSQVEFMESVDPLFLSAGAHDLTLAAQEAAAMVQVVNPDTRYELRLDTAWGLIVLTGGSDTAHQDRQTLLVIDTGGNDTYLNIPNNRIVTNWCSVVLDSAGNDKYLSSPGLASTSIDKFPKRADDKFVPGPASALFGYVVLIDIKGDDLYRSARPGIASATMGCAVLLDRDGNDTYDAYGNSEGYAMFGIALLEDDAGDDTYSGFNQVQGVGQTLGCGMLIDRAGKDSYLANDTVLDIPSPQTKDHNVSMAQGAGNGRRADYLDGHSLSGGIGLLFDQGGDDQYTCGVFGQGVGYWEGLGMLWDSGGMDKYVGQWYVQGAAAHYAVGYLEDSGGNDVYSAKMNMAQGAGHDFSTGYLLDRTGDDIYQAPNLSLGAGNSNGIGVLVDFAGNDQYEASGLTLGQAAEALKGSIRERCLTLGVFMDLGGNDTYPGSAGWAKNGSRAANWRDRGPTSPESQVGVFWDR